MYICLANGESVNFFHRICECFRGVRDPGDTRADRGVFGENLAADYCRNELGYRLIVRNWSHKKGEIDLICQDGEVLVFIEVRARAKDALVSGFHSVSRRKKEILHRTCKSYLRQLKNPPKHFRFDIVDISICNTGQSKVRHYANVPIFHKHFSIQRGEL